MVARVNSGWCEYKVSGVLRKYDMYVYVCVCVCVCVQWDDVSDTMKPGHNSTKPEAGIPYANLEPETEKYV